MIMPRFLRGVGAALLALALFGETTGHAASANYEFMLVDPQVKRGQTVIDVRLIHKRDGKPVPDAVIFATRLDMAPDDMESMTSAIEQVKGPGPGVYRFKVDLTDEGRWRISLAAKVQGESETLQSRLVVQVTP